VEIFADAARQFFPQAAIIAGQYRARQNPAGTVFPSPHKIDV